MYPLTVSKHVFKPKLKESILYARNKNLNNLLYANKNI